MYYWPIGVSQAEPLEGFIEAFATLGFNPWQATLFQRSYQPF
jgi:hypothetical protein